MSAPASKMDLSPLYEDGGGQEGATRKPFQPSGTTAVGSGGKIHVPFKRVEFVGTMMALDVNGRMRIAILRNQLDGRPSGEANRLFQSLPHVGPDYSTPFKFDTDIDVSAVVTVAIPARHRDYWKKRADELRGLEVKVEATVRTFDFVGDAGRVCGFALDVSMVKPTSDTK